MTNAKVTPTLIPNDIPTCRISVHRDDDSAVWVIVEEMEEDAIGSPQWRPEVDSRASKLSCRVVTALIDYAAPHALRGDPRSSTALGTTKDGGDTIRCSVQRREGKRLVLIAEKLASDAFGAPRWLRLTADTILDKDGDPVRHVIVNADAVIACLFPSAREINASIANS